MKERDAEEMKLFNAVKHICSLNDALWDLERMDRTDLCSTEKVELFNAMKCIENVLTVEKAVARGYSARLEIDVDINNPEEMDKLNKKLARKHSTKRK